MAGSPSEDSRMTKIIDVNGVSAQFPRLIRQIMDGDQTVIMAAGVPVAVLRAYEERPADRTPGQFVGEIVVHNNFDDALDDFAADS